MTLTIIIFSTILSAFFSGMEIAFISSNKLLLELASKEKSVSGKILNTFINNSSQYISTMLVGNNLALVVFGIFMAQSLNPLISIYTQNNFYILIIQTIISTSIILVVAEFFPKAIFSKFSNDSLKFFAIPLAFFYYLFYPFVAFIIGLINLFIKLFSGKTIDTKTRDRVFSKIDIYDIIDNNENSGVTNSTNEFKIFKNAMDFSLVKLRECIVPRNKIVAIPISSSMEDLIETFIQSGHSKILVYEETVDEISSYVYVKDLFNNPKDIKKIVRNVITVPETMSAKKLFERLIHQRVSLAVVVDEFGSTSGIVSIEDILEEIFGKFEDEHDLNNTGVTISPQGDYIINGREEVDTFNQEFGFDLSQEQEYETIAGYILHHLEYFPKEGANVKIKDKDKTYIFNITKIINTRIEKVTLKDSNN